MPSAPDLPKSSAKCTAVGAQPPHTPCCRPEIMEGAAVKLSNIPLQSFWLPLTFPVAVAPSPDSSRACKQLYLIKLGHNLPEEGMQHGELFAQVDVAIVSRHVGDGIWVRELPQKTLHSSPLMFQKLIHEGHVLFLNTKPAGKGGGGETQSITSTQYTAYKCLQTITYTLYFKPAFLKIWSI